MKTYPVRVVPVRLEPHPNARSGCKIHGCSA